MQKRQITQPERRRWIKSTASVAIPSEAAQWLLPYDRTPKRGDCVLVRVTKLGHMRSIENLRGCEYPHYCPRDLILGSTIWAVFGPRCGIRLGKVGVPDHTAPIVHLHGEGGLVGLMEHQVVENPEPTEVEVLGYLGNDAGTAMNTRSFAPVQSSSDPLDAGSRPLIIVVGSDTDAGKTQACRTIITSLYKAGREVVAAKATGVAFMQDVSHFDPQASFVTDFARHGIESTIGIGEREAVSIFHRVNNELIGNSPEDAVRVIELADGIINPETKSILMEAQSRGMATHVVFASAGVMAAMSGAQILKELGITDPIFSGRLFNSGVGREQAATHIGGSLRCFNSGLEPGPELVEQIFGIFGTRASRAIEAAHAT